MKTHHLAFFGLALLFSLGAGPTSSYGADQVSKKVYLCSTVGAADTAIYIASTADKKICFTDRKAVAYYVIEFAHTLGGGDPDIYFASTVGAADLSVYFASTIGAADKTIYITDSRALADVVVYIEKSDLSRQQIFALLVALKAI